MKSGFTLVTLSLIGVFLLAQTVVINPFTGKLQQGGVIGPTGPTGASGGPIGPTGATGPTGVFTGTFTPTSVDPGCALSGDLGKPWVDSTSAVTTHYKICLNVAAAPTWVTII